MLKYHTNLHHSQTLKLLNPCVFSLSTILIYIILKLMLVPGRAPICLSTILIYIILKPYLSVYFFIRCLSTILIYIILKLPF